MPYLIGRVEEGFKSIKVGRDTFKIFSELAVKRGSHTASYLNFTDDVFRDIISKNLPLNEDTIKRHISTF